jgi:hypothetical protein
MKKELYWITASLVTSIIISGLVFSFNFIDAVEVQYHDTYIVVFPFSFGLVLWTILTFVIFLVKGVKTKFSNTTLTTILLLANSLLSLLAILATWQVYLFFIFDVVFDTFRETRIIGIISKQFTCAMITCLVVTAMLLTGEFLLIKRLVKLKAKE